MVSPDVGYHDRGAHRRVVERRSMKLRVFACAFFALAPRPAQLAAQVCTPSGDYIAGQPMHANRFPTTLYDAATHQRITYDIDEETGGYVSGEDTLAGGRWHAGIATGGAMHGRDLDGADWDYAPATHLCTNRSAGRTYAHTSLMHVCPG
jgi:hypothetical protein